ncbi:MAG TPA: Wzz/FepE/Etk N-terminal domain-containing protein [Gaiellaceae bacterium]|nr:Wzz/FepE/Etk N-terminal domain-containing protein [Gaiellaceae bacterium]
MALETPPRKQRERPVPDVDAEDELDVGRYWNALIARWWLPLAGLVAGIAIGYLLSLGGHQVYQAKASVYLGQPLNPTGTGQIQSLTTNPSTVKQVVLSPFWQHVAERRAGLPSGSLRGHVSTQAVAGVAAALGRVGQNPLVNIVVTGKRPARVTRAADELATIVVNQVSGQYVDTKIKNLKTNIAADKAELDNINGRLSSLQDQIRGGSISATDKLILGNLIGLAIQEQRQVIADQTQNQSLLALAQSVERSQVLSPARASKTTARSRRNSILVGALIGLVIGILAALLWEPAARVVRRASV